MNYCEHCPHCNQKLEEQKNNPPKQEFKPLFEPVNVSGLNNYPPGVNPQDL